MYGEGGGRGNGRRDVGGIKEPEAEKKGKKGIGELRHWRKRESGDRGDKVGGINMNRTCMGKESRRRKRKEKAVTVYKKSLDIAGGEKKRRISMHEGVSGKEGYRKEEEEM